MRVLGLILAMVMFTSQGKAFVEDHLVISESQKVFYKYQKPEAGQPTIVMLNGLIYSLSNWDRYFDLMAKKGFGLLQIAYSTQPESLALLTEPPYFVGGGVSTSGVQHVNIDTQTLVDEVMLVVDSLGISRFQLLSLSYGSIVAAEMAIQQKDRIDTLLFIAPAVLPSNRYNAYGESRHQHYVLQKQFNMNPFYNPEDFYDLEIYQAMLPIIGAQQAQYQFENVKFMDFFHGVYQMARSAKWFDLKEYADREFPPTHFFLASLEDPPLYQDQLAFWKLLEGNTARRSVTFFQGGFHALPGIAPVTTAKFSEKVFRGLQESGEHKAKLMLEDLPPSGQGNG